MKKIPNVNAGHIAIIYDVKGNAIGECMDTPNNCAYAFKTNEKAVTVKTPFNGIWDRKYLSNYFNGLDENYHKPFVKFY